MARKETLGWLVLLWMLSSYQTVHSQEVSAIPGRARVALNQVWTLEVKLKNAKISRYSPFPEIPNMRKRGVSSSSSHSITNGRVTSSHSIVQNYIAVKLGTVMVPDFVMELNGQKLNFKGGGKVTIGPASQKQARRNDPFDSFFGFSRADEPVEFVDVKADAFLNLSTGKSEVYLGEGFVLSLSFYVAHSNRANMQFHELNKQLGEIIKKIKPTNCWEERFEIGNVDGVEVKVNGKPYTRYKIYQSAFYPLNLEPIEFPSVGLDFIKFKVARNPRFFGSSRKRSTQRFYSRPRSVSVKPLPDHPLKDVVSVGKYRLKENIDPHHLETGRSFKVNFTIEGEGNVSAIHQPFMEGKGLFDFYPPNTRSRVNRTGSTVRGSKSFDFYGIPNEPGDRNMGDFLYWVYFDPYRVRYDTLKSQLQLAVTGESRKDEYISSADVGTFYDRIALEDSTLLSLDSKSWLPLASSLFAFLILGASVALVFLRPRYLGRTGLR